MLICHKEPLLRTQLLSIFILMLLLLPLFGSAASRPVVTLTDTNGVTASGKIIFYSARRDLIKLRQDGGSSSFAVSALSPESRQTIERWQADENFESRSSMDISFRRKDWQSTSNLTGTITQQNGEEREDIYGYEETHFCRYKITLKNESETPFENLIADYRVFFTQKLTENYTGKYQLAGTESFATLDAGDSLPFSTAKFLCGISYRSAPRINWTGMPPSSLPNVQGVLLRIRKRGMDGEWIEREVEHGDVPRRRDRSDYQKVYE